MANVIGTVGAGNIINPHDNELSFFVYEPPSCIHPTSSPTLPIDAYLDHGDYGRAYFGASHDNFSPHHLHELTLPDHIGGGHRHTFGNTFLPFSFPSSISPVALLMCNTCVTLHKKRGDVRVTHFTYLIYKDFECVTHV